MSKNRRRYPRKEVNNPVEITAGERSYEGTIRDISVGGAAVEFQLSAEDGRARFDIGSRVEMLPDKSDKKSARVIREYTSGMAVQFDTQEEKD